SVITPAFNAALTLRRAHESLATQTTRWQHVIIDDGSTDGTPVIVKDLARHPRVLSVRTGNNGTGAALNAGIQLATGEYVTFLDADDEYLPGHLSSRLAAMLEHPEIDILWGGVEVVTDSPEDALVPDICAGAGFISVLDCVVQG